MKAPALILAASLLAPAAFAATLAVLPGSSIQAKVDAAAPGDIVAIFGGTYPGDVTVNKAIRLVEVDGQDVTITGNVTFTGITNAPPFEGFTVGSSGKGITITNTTGIVLNNIDARPGSGVTVNGTSKAGITGGYYSQISQDGGELTATLTQVTGTFNTTVNAQKTVIHRLYNTGNTTIGSKLAWVGYSRLNPIRFIGSQSKVVIVCNYITENWGNFVPTISLQGTENRFLVYNNQMIGIYWGNCPPYYSRPGQGIEVNSNNSADIINNYISMNREPADVPTYSIAGAGIVVSAGKILICNNIITGAGSAIRAPYGAIVRNNLIYNSYYANISDGVVDINTVIADPKFVSGQAPTLQPISPCVNGGVSDPIYNDFDGTRNDIGPGGGCLFDPQGWTTANPVIISFDLAPQQLLKGVDTSVNISNGEAVAQP